jgi:hypothetical protein
MTMRFYTTCVNCSREELPLLNAMCDGGEQITRRSFLGKVDKWEMRGIERDLGYERDIRRGLKMNHDWHVAYFKSKWGDLPCVYFVWSAIEYVFVKEEGMPTKMYRVAISGQPHENDDTFDDRESAEGYALRTAKRMAHERGIDPDSIDIWGGPDDKEWGAFPEGSEGGDWPIIQEVQE